MLAIVQLDNPTYGAGPATVLELVKDENPEVSPLQSYADRDGCLPEGLRLWRVSASVTVGMKVVLSETAALRASRSE